MDTVQVIAIAFLAGAAFALCVLYLARFIRGSGEAEALRARASGPAVLRPWDAKETPPRGSAPRELEGHLNGQLEGERERLRAKSAGLADLSRQGDSIVLGATMDECLERLTADGTIRSVVVADDLGLLLSTSGDDRYHEPLAVLTGLTAGIFAQIGGALPIGPPRSLELTDQNGVVILCRFLPHGQQRLAVTSLGLEGRSTSPELERSLGGLEAILEHHNAA